MVLAGWWWRKSGRQQVPNLTLSVGRHRQLTFWKERLSFVDLVSYRLWLMC